MTNLATRLSHLETFHHLTCVISNLERLGLYADADEIRKTRDDLETRHIPMERARLSSGPSDKVATLSDADAMDMATYGIRFEKMYWVTGLLAGDQGDLQLVRFFQSMVESGDTRRTRRFGQAVRDIRDVDQLLEAGWGGFVVRVDIAAASYEYDFVPHWSDQFIHWVYVDQPAHALPLARILRDRLIKDAAAGEGVKVPPQNLASRSHINQVFSDRRKELERERSEHHSYWD